MLKVSENRRFLVKEDNSPFFYLGDTGWALLQRLDRDEMDLYLRDRASKGYTVIQVMGISEFDGLTVPNRYGDVPFEDLDPTRPTEGYFEHVDWVVDRAAELGLHIGLLPTWGDKVGPLQWGTGPEVFTPENAAVYGEFLGERYRDKPIIWVIGGDRNPTEPRHYATWRAMAEGVKRGDGGRHLMTFHPQGGSSSSAFFHDDPWLSFNMLQSGHARRNGANYEMIHQDYTRTPTKPCLDGEPCYEDHPVNWKPEGGYFAAYDVRKAAYWALFAGAHGHTYGCNGVFQFWKSGQEDRFGVLRPWQEAIELPGAAQMQHARRLMESRPFLQRIPNQGLLASDPGKGTAYTAATRSDDGSYAFVYTASGQPFTVRLDQLSGAAVTAYWYDPRQGTAERIGEFESRGDREFAPPSSGPDNDWVLVLDDAAREFPAPGNNAVV
ncbi:MAG: glycoside hydrolase family 140 protein [Chloroflexota bacterium]|nr:glycoside hydrolase family 140 protein [Chloroflexota bacterium]